MPVQFGILGWTSDAKQIEAVQRRSSRFVKNCWERKPGTVTNLLNDLDWPTLGKERSKVSENIQVIQHETQEGRPRL
jgi:hypothetical protein